MTLEEEKRLLLLMASYRLKGNVSKGRVLDYIESQNWINFVPHDLESKHNRNELVWRNDLAFIRKHLALEGLYASGTRNDWSITAKGVNALKLLCQQVASEGNLKKISVSAKQSAADILDEITG